MRRTALSPLVAMVVMLAFLISFLTVILSWATTYIVHEWESYGMQKIERACGSVALSLAENGACYSMNLDRIKLTVENAGTGRIIGLNISMEAGLGIYSVRDFENTPIEPISRFENEFSYPQSYGMPREMRIVPIVSLDKKPFHCNMSSLVIERSSFSVCPD